MSETPRRFPIRDLLARLFAIDLRALGVFRILLAIVLMVDYAGRLPDLDAHYTEAGVTPLRAAQLFHATDYGLLFSPYVWNGSHDWSLTLMILGIIAALVMLVGWHTRWAVFISWYLLIGLHTRYPLVLEGYDVYVRMMLFWSLFMPLGARYSIDGAAAQHVAHKLPLPRYALSVATAGMLLQVGMVYWFNALAKTSPQWRSEFTALYYALSLQSFTTPAGNWFRENVRWALVPATMITFFLEAYGPFFAFIPVATEKIRPYVVAAFICFHLFGIGLFMNVGAFHYIAALPWILFLPSSFWDTLGRYWNTLPIAPLRNPISRVQDAVIAWRSRRIARAIQQGARPPRLALPLLGQLVAFFFLLFILNWNLRSTNQLWTRKYLPLPQMAVVWLTRVDQFWGMFSPMPMGSDVWVVIPAQTLTDAANGTVFDMYRMQTPVNYRKPHSVEEFYKNTRWRKYLTNIYDTQYGNQRAFYCQWLAREWNRTHHGPQSLMGLWFCVVEATTLPNYQQPKPVLRVLHRYWSFVPNAPVSLIPPGVPTELIPPTPPSPKQGVAKNGVNRSP
jgi:hypothetical protein